MGRSDLLDLLRCDRGIHFGERGLFGRLGGLLLEVFSADGRVADVVAVACSDHGGGGELVLYCRGFWYGRLDSSLWRVYGEDVGGD